MKKIFAVTIVLSSNILLNDASYAQILGCTDPQASNYNAAATSNDGSCVYTISNISPTFQCNLSDTIKETSGLIQFDNTYWTHNDSGAEPILYRVNPTTGFIIHAVRIYNASLIDWEAITQDDDYIYIGDFGNNYGNRTNLRIYKIYKHHLSTVDSIAADTITFSYADQYTLDDSLNGTSFDCEAFIAKHDSLYLFTKDWLTLATHVYSVPILPGHYSASKSVHFNIDGLITDASYHKDSNLVALLGYKKLPSGMYNCFAWLLWDFEANHFFSGNKRRIELGNVISLGQTEGIMLEDDYQAYISGEYISEFGVTLPAKLHRIDFSKFFKSATAIFNPSLKASTISVFPNPSNDVIYLDAEHLNNLPYKIYNMQGQLMHDGIFNGIQIDIKSLPSGQYIIHTSQYKNIRFTKK